MPPSPVPSASLAPTPAAVVAALGLAPLLGEGGWFRQSWRAGGSGTTAGRPAGTAILFLMTPDDFSGWHRLDADEVWHFHGGSPAEHVQLRTGGGVQRLVLGPDPLAGHHPQIVCPAGTWQAARPVPGGAWSLLGCTMAPGYHDAGCELGRAAALRAGWPAAGDIIAALARA